MSTPRKYRTPRKSATPGRLPPRGTPPRMTPRKTPRKTPMKDFENESDEEGIQVAIRMRPLNAKEANANRIWRVLPQYNSVTQTTSTGQPLPERVNGRTFFTFDRTFGEDASNVDVYDNVAKGIVESVATGLNGTIFAYGQTSSGKTFTMQGSGSIEEGYSSGGGGVVHMAANDIFAHVKNTPDRIFLIRASFIEIYNEEVRDLLGDNEVLAIREDPRRGVFVNATEEIVTDFESLLRVLFSGEKNRAVAATGMNERSSRSHTIFRITIESRQKGEDYSENDMSSSNSSLPSDDGAVRISTLNLVDLAGSESVRHTGSTGDRQKEGGKINQSLLTLSRVIVGLGQPNQTHINFRDSKLTRILQPSLSGNARMAVICCATPSEFYLEETRSTLLFASRAKLVKTRAQVNEVLDDRSLIKRLQRELAEARRASAGPGQLQHLKALEAEALNAGTAARDAEKKLDKLKSSILNHAIVFGAHPTASDANAGNSNQAMIPGIETKKRRLSDGAIMIDRAALQTPSRATTSQPVSSPLSVPHEHKKLKRTERKGPLSPSSELALVREAYNAKVEHAKGLEQRLLDMERKVSQGEESLLQASQTIREVESDKNAAIQESQHLSSEISSLFTEMQAAALRHDAAMKELSEKLESEQSSKTALEESLSILAKEIKQLKEDACGAKEEALAESTKAAEETSRLETIIQALSTEKSKFVGECEHLRASQDIANRKIFELETVNDELQAKTEAVTTSMEQSLQELNDKYETDVESLAAEKQILEQFVEQLEQDVKSSTDEIIDAHSRITDLKNEVEEKSKLVGTLTESVEETKTLLETSENEKSDLSMQLAETKTLIANATEEIQDLKADLENKVAINTELELQVVSLISKDEANANAMQKLANELEEATEKATFEQAEKERVQSLLDACTVERNEVQLRLDSVNKDLEHAKEAIMTSTETIEELESDRDSLYANLNSQITSLESAKAEVEAKLVETRGELESLCNEKQFLSEELEARRANEVALKDKLHDLTNEVEDKSAVVDKLTKSVEEINASLKTSANAKLDLSMQLAESKTAVENATKEIQDLKADLENKGAKNTELELQVVSLTSKDEANAKAMQKLANELEEATEKATFEQAEKERVQSLLDACTVERNEVQLRLDSVNKDLEHAKEAIMTSTETIEELESERDLLCANLNSQITSLESAKAEVEAKLVETRGDLESLCNEKQFLSEELEARRANEVALKDRLKDVHDSLSAALEEIDSLKASIVVLESQREELNATFATFSADKASMESQVMALQSSKVEVDTKLAEAVDRLVALETEKQGLFDDILAHQANEEVQKEALRIMQALLEARQEEIESLRSKISENEGERNQLGESLEATQAEKDKLKVQVISLEAAKSETEARLAKAVIQVDTLESEKQEIYASIEAHDSNETKTANSLKEAQEQIQSLHAVIEDLQASENDAEHSKLMLQKVEAEATELKQLLAVANDSVREARDAALAAEDELEEKEREVQSLLQQLADSEENLRVATDKLSALDGQAGSSVNDELQQRIDELSNEIAAAKLELKNERSEQKIATEQLKRQMAEEERALVNEAESRMAALNGRVVELTASLSTSEAEAYAARQELEDLQDQNKRLEDVALEVDMLRQSEKRLKDQVSSLSEARLELQSQLSQAKQQLESQSQDSDREVVETIAELNRVKNECFEAKQKGIDLSHQVEQLVQENSSSAREIRLFREKTAVLESSLSKLEDENQTLSSRLRDLEHTQSQQKDNAAQLVELDELNSRIRELESIIGKKDDRIAKLQKVKLTKTKVAEINKLRAEHAQYQNEAEHCRHELAAANKTISELQSKVASVSREVSFTASGDEMASMKFAKEALETKLRKYAAHCQYLENEKANIIDALKSVEGCDAHDGDISSAVVALCDKYSSLEEECEALMSAEKRASSHLSELDHLRQANSRLESSASEAEKKIERLTHVEAELTRKLNDAKDKVATLRNERDSLKAERGSVADLESENRRQVRYLEQENLQLMLDLKNAKKQLKSTRAQLDAMRMKVDDDETADLGGVTSHVLSTAAAAAGTGGSRTIENNETQSIGSKRVASPTDKENDIVNADFGYTMASSDISKGTESARKRRFTRPALSSKKRRNTNTPGRIPGLGEAGTIDEDHTGDCKTS